MTGGAFADQLGTVTPDGGRPGRYRADIAAHWNCPLVPQGGVVAAVAAHAMRCELDAPDQPIRSLTTLFVTPVPAGPVTVDVEVVRRGRSLSQVRATLAPAGAGGTGGSGNAGGSGEGTAVGQTVLAVFGRPRAGYAFADAAMPTVPPPEDCVSVRDPAPEGFERTDIRFWEHVDSRMAIGHLPWDEEDPTSSEIGLWYRFDEPPRGPDGALDPLALVALSDTMLASMDERLGRRQGWWAPSADLTVHLLAESRAEWLLAHLRSHRAAGGYASAEISLWDPEAGLVAYGTQVLYFTFLDGPPPEAELAI